MSYRGHPFKSGKGNFAEKANEGSKCTVCTVNPPPKDESLSTLFFDLMSVLISGGTYMSLGGEFTVKDLEKLNDNEL